VPDQRPRLRAGQGRPAPEDRRRQGGYVYLHSAVDGFSRLAYTEPLPDEKATTTMAFLGRARAFFAAHGLHRVVCVGTDGETLCPASAKLAPRHAQPPKGGTAGL
jgi:hypothetical protein